MDDWKAWCRLCATAEMANDSLMNLGRDCIESMKQYFSIELCTGDDEFPIVVCADCLKFAIKLESFSKQCIRVDKMFTHLVTVWKDGLIRKNLSEIRYEYGIDSDSFDHDKLQEQNVNNEMSTSNEIVQYLDLQNQQVDLKDTSIPRRKRLASKLKRSMHTMKVSRKNVDHNCVGEKDNKTNTKLKPNDQTIQDDNLTTEMTTLKMLISCPICSKLFNNAKLRTSHLKREHATIKRPYKCVECPKAFTELFQLKLHTIIHLPDNEKPVHKCLHCDKIFSRAVSLYTHVKNIHLNERKFICEECGKSFHSNCWLKDHYLTHSEERSVQCSYCSKSFKNHKQLKIHEDTHSGTSYECKICNKILNTKRNLNGHMKVHSDEKQFKCHLCNNEYKRKKALRRHIGNNHLGLNIK